MAHITYLSLFVGTLFFGLVGAAAIGAAVWLPRMYAESAKVIREQRELLSALLVGITDAVIIADSTGRVSLINSAAQMLLGWSQHEVSGKPTEAVLHLIDEKTRRRMHKPGLREGEILSQDHPIILVSRSGTEWTAEGKAVPIVNASDKVSGTIFIFREIGKIRHLEKELQRQAAALRMLTPKNNQW